MKKLWIGSIAILAVALAASFLVPTSSKYEDTINFAPIEITNSASTEEEIYQENKKQAEAVIDYLTSALYDKDSMAYKFFAGYNISSGKYGSRKGYGSTIDSTGKNYAGAVKDEIADYASELDDFNLNTTYSFRIYLKYYGFTMDRNEYNIFYTPVDIESMAINAELPFVYRYCTSNLDTPVVSIGTSKVIKGSSGTQRIISGYDYSATEVIKNRW